MRLITTFACTNNSWILPKSKNIFVYINVALWNDCWAFGLCTTHSADCKQAVCHKSAVKPRLRHVSWICCTHVQRMFQKQESYRNIPHVILRKCSNRIKAKFRVSRINMLFTWPISNYKYCPIQNNSECKVLIDQTENPNLKNNDEL